MIKVKNKNRIMKKVKNRMIKIVLKKYKIIKKNYII